MLRNPGLIGMVVVVFWIIGYFWLASDENPSPTSFQPEGHFKTFHAADNSPERSEELYNSLRGDMADRYAEASEPSVMGYQNWQRFNTAPYLSATHGDRFVNNYGNALAGDYTNVLTGAAMPAGAILAKDAFAVTEEGQVFAQSLFVMEKLGAGRSPETADWRYVMITAAGEVYGDSMGENAMKVTFCHECHQQVAGQDYLFFVPEAFRTASR
ncbi:MAG: cytochrome P460 family protein [Minwuia sp.]|nr:cytochrome P460 family protein [Minwuia sp.]